MKKGLIGLFIIFSFCCASCFKGNDNQTEAGLIEKEDPVDGKSSWLESLEDAKDVAMDEDKAILLLVTADEDGFSKNFKNNIFYRHSFVEKLSQDYVFANLDFSSEYVNFALENGEMTLIDNNRRTASLYSIQLTPSIIILSKEGYYITQIIPDSKLQTVKDFFVRLEHHKAIIQKMLTLIRNTADKGDSFLSAIDELFEATDKDYRYILNPLCEIYVDLDADNKTGLCGKYMIASCDYKARQLFYDQEFDAAAALYENLAQNNIMTAIEKQTLYYQCGFMMSVCGSTDLKFIKSIFEKALNAAPDSEYSKEIEKTIKLIDEQEKRIKEYI